MKNKEEKNNNQEEKNVICLSRSGFYFRSFDVRIVTLRRKSFCFSACVFSVIAESNTPIERISKRVKERERNKNTLFQNKLLF